jgi:hypothetical protein
MNLFMVVIAVGVVLTASKWPFKTALFPMVIGITVFFMSFAELLLSLFGREERGKKQSAIDFKLSEDVDKAVALRRTLLTFGWIVGFFLFILFFGFSIAVPLFVFLYIKLYGKEKWVISVTMAVMSWFFFYGLFVRLLDTPFEEGLVLKVLKAIVIG